jgi:hypothetical protein
MAEAAGKFELKGSAPLDEWRKRIEAVRAQIHAHDEAQKQKRKRAKKMRGIAIGVALPVGILLGVFVHPVAGVIAAVVGMGAAGILIKAPPADFIGEERVDFVRELIALLTDIAPKGRLQLTAQLDPRRGVPAAELPKAGSEAQVSKETKEAWLAGNLLAVPGLRLAWQVTEWRVVTLVRRTVRRRRVKIKEKAKFMLATRLAVRLDVDRTLFALKPVANPQRAQDGESTVEVRERPGGWSLRGRRDLKQKTPLWSVDVAEGLATLREQGKAEFFGQPAASLINLMKLCEGRLLAAARPAPAKGAAS